jgi:hypothetical protein
MPLSEHEQRLLEQMERALYADDPKLASTLRGARGGAHDHRRLLLGGLGLLAGVALLIGGVATEIWPLGVVGFLVMLGSAWLAISGWQGRATVAGSADRPAPGGAPGKPAKAPRTSFMRRIEERWDRRRDERGR